MNRDELRDKFINKGCSFKTINKQNISALCNYLNKELKQFNNEGFTMKLRAFRLNDVEYNSIGELKKCYIMVSGKVNNEFYHFKRREAISFNECSEFIGFAGWADHRNVKPFLKAFNKWLDNNCL